VKPAKPRTRRLVRDDRRYLWHPFTQMQAWMDGDPVVVIEKGRGFTLVDTDGNRYLDGVSSLWCSVHGHGVKKIDRAVRKQLSRIAHSTLLGLASPPSIRLAAVLVRLAPAGLDRVFYSDNGATAVEAAVKMALQYHAQTGHPERNLFAGLVEAYHGDTMGSVSVGGMDSFHSMFSPLRFDTVRIPSPHCYRCPEGLDPKGCAMECADRAADMIGKNADRLAAAVIEPLVQGAAGMIVHPPGFLKRIREACDRSGVLLIADEVATGFGRTGTLLACSQEEVTPDLLCLAKGISGGYLPLAATLATEKVFSAFLGSVESGRAFYHGHTYTGNALGCAAALESIRLLQSRVMPGLPGRAAHLADLLDRLVRPLPHVGDVRGRGLMVGIELVRSRETREPFPAADRTGHRVILEARRRGVMLRPLGDVIVLMPAPAMGKRDLGRLVSVTAESIRTVTGG
jgi:adenosylmethionine-8-amino-7-oxononanoate aminotransferase